MLNRIRVSRVAFASALFVAGSAGGAAAQSAGSDHCKLEYARATASWGTAADASRNGWEAITLQPGQKKVFSTDWKYEKLKNDGTNYYGSHARYHSSTGNRTVRMVFKPSAFETKTVYLEPGTTSAGMGSTYFATQVIGGWSGDIVEVACI